ncbi:hypothetical protein [Parashewanella tropica]|uniref:hypothetical protein n=1 Tax=Parashewanella tropica TaxID=2547970 RepID=UPI00105A4854|nr:hypothetical protein [Parashewanella tropica]
MDIKRYFLATVCCLNLVTFSSVAATIPLHMECAHTSGFNNTVFQFPKNLGFFFVNSDVSPSDVYGLEFKDPNSETTYAVSGFKYNTDFAVTLNKLVTDQQSNQRVRRFKVKFLERKQDSNFDHKNLMNGEHSTPISNSTDNDTFGVTTFTKYCDIYPKYSADLQYEVRLIVPYSSGGRWGVSKPGTQISENAIPIDFKGGNGSPLKMYIEGGLTVTGINYQDEVRSSLYPQTINLKLTSLGSNLGVAAFDSVDGEVNRFNYYSNIRKLGSHAGVTNFVIDHNSLSFEMGLIDNATLQETEFNSLPSVLETVTERNNSISPALYNAPTPEPGWYSPDIVVNTRIHSSLGNKGIISSASVDEKQTVITSNSTEISEQISKLMEAGDAWQDELLAPEAFPFGRFYTISSIDGDGRIKLKSIEPNTSSDGNVNYLDFSKISDGDIVWWGSLVRWFIKDDSGNEIVQQGFIGWHAPDGSYAFLNLSGNTKSLNTLPHIGDIVAFEYVMLN